MSFLQHCFSRDHHTYMQVSQRGGQVVWLSVCEEFPRFRCDSHGQNGTVNKNSVSGTFCLLDDPSPDIWRFLWFFCLGFAWADIEFAVYEDSAMSYWTEHSWHYITGWNLRKLAFSIRVFCEIFQICNCGTHGVNLFGIWASSGWNSDRTPPFVHSDAS